MKTILRTTACLVFALLAGFGMSAAIGHFMVGHWGLATPGTVALTVLAIPSVSIIGAFVVLNWGVFPRILRRMACVAIALLAGLGMYVVALDLMFEHLGLGKGSDTIVLTMLVITCATGVGALVPVNWVVFPRSAKKVRGEPGR